MSYKDLSKKEKAQVLKDLREEHIETVTHAQALLKKQNAVRKKIRKAMGKESKTVTQIANIVEMPTHEVFWHIASMKKYDLVAEDGMEDFVDVLYKIVEDK
ncbi:MAG: hypothetical protein DRI56_11705 [Chloroflexota bacterium]|nr:MAG: hypothetical protein DRI56_11705 [Chloroflexota bacterium]